MSSRVHRHHPDGCVTFATDPEHPAIRIEDVSMRWGRRQVLRDVSYTVNYGDFVAITGPNGGGKTTLLRIILGLTRPTSGVVRYFDEEARPVSRIDIGYLPQKNMIDSHFPILVEEVVGSGLLGVKGLDAEERQGRVDDTIALMGLEAHRRQPIGVLSGGQLQRALLGRALVSRPGVLVLDEPLSYIDKRFESRLYDILSGVSEDTTILLVSHELSMIDHMANRHIIIDGGLHECSAPHHYVSSGCD